MNLKKSFLGGYNKESVNALIEEHNKQIDTLKEKESALTDTITQKSSEIVNLSSKVDEMRLEIEKLTTENDALKIEANKNHLIFENIAKIYERAYGAGHDVVNEEFLRFPLTVLANPKYREMSLEAKFIYSLLLNRLTLSQKNNWINEDNEVYLIYTREDAANTLNITYRKAISAFKELIEAGLLFEQRQGRGFPNLLYVLKAELADEDALEFEEKFNGSDDENDEKEPANPVNMQTCSFRSS